MPRRLGPCHRRLYKNIDRNDFFILFLFFFVFAQVFETFRMDIKQLHEVWKDTNLMWLKQAEYMPKQLDVPLSDSYLATLTLREVLRTVYIRMQNMAVGLEQVVYDMEQERLRFAKDLKDTTHKLRAVSLIVTVIICYCHVYIHCRLRKTFKTTFERLQFIKV